MLDLLRRLGDTKVAARFIADILMKEYDGSENAALAAVASVLGASETGRLFAALVTAKMRSFPHECTNLLRELIKHTAASEKPWRAALREVAAGGVGALSEIKNPSAPARFTLSGTTAKMRKNRRSQSLPRWSLICSTPSG